MSKYTEKVEKLIKGDNAKDIALSNQKKLITAVKSQLALKEGLKLDKEEAITDAEEVVEKTLLAGGKPIGNASDRDSILQAYFTAKYNLEKAKEDLVAHERDTEWLRDALKELE